MIALCLQDVLKQQGAFEEEDARIPCKHCSRKFNPDRIAKHELICGKVDTKKRKPLDSKKWRLEGTDFQEHFDEKQSAKDLEKVKAEKKKADQRWRAQHAQIQAVAAADAAGSGGAAAGAGAAPPTRRSPPSPSPDGQTDAQPTGSPAPPVPGDAAAVDPPKKPVIRVGDRVRTGDGREGKVLFKGPVWGLKKGNWYGVDLDQALGKCDGSYQEQKYFMCEPNHGIFIRGGGLESLAAQEAVKLAAELAVAKEEADRLYEQQKQVRAKAAATAAAKDAVAAAGAAKRREAGLGAGAAAASATKRVGGAAAAGATAKDPSGKEGRFAAKLRADTAAARAAEGRGRGAAAARPGGSSRPSSGGRGVRPSSGTAAPSGGRGRGSSSTRTTTKRPGNAALLSGAGAAEKAHQARMAADAEMLAALSTNPNPTDVMPASAAARPGSSGGRFSGGGGRLGGNSATAAASGGACKAPAAGGRTAGAAGRGGGRAAKPAAAGSSKPKAAPATGGMSDREKRAAFFAKKFGGE